MFHKATLPIIGLAIFLLAVSSANANPVTLLCPVPQCLLTFETNAGWEQKVTIRNDATKFAVTQSGSGEGAVHYRTIVVEGVYEISAWHRQPGGDWDFSTLVAEFEEDGHVARANDGGTADHTSVVDDEDFNDSIVTLKPVSPASAF